MPFNVGDCVTRARRGFSRITETILETNTKGTVCAVISPGLSYRVLFEGMDMCVIQFDASLVSDIGTGPDCLDHDSCIGQ
jgi:hypothetical protein